MVDEQREHRAKENIFAFLQRRSIEQRRSYLARGRRFVVLDVVQLSKSWTTAVKNWLARKDRASEITMDDLTAELRLRGLEPPYGAVKQDWPLASPEWTRPRKGKLEENSREKSACSSARATSRSTEPKRSSTGSKSRSAADRHPLTDHRQFDILQFGPWLAGRDAIQ